MNTMEISVVIPTYNEQKNIKKCLHMLNKQTLPRSSYEIIIVDDSTDKTPLIAKKSGADKVIKQKSKGIGGARNDGVRAAKGEIIATTDADVIIPKTWLEQIKKNFNKKNVVGVCGLTSPIEVHDREIKNLMESMMAWAQIMSAIGLPIMRGTNCAFKKKEFLKIKGYRPLTMMDDFELGLRLAKTGKIFFDKKLIVKASGRRIKKMGSSKYLMEFGINGLLLLLTGNVPPKKYAKENYT